MRVLITPAITPHGHFSGRVTSLHGAAGVRQNINWQNKCHVHEETHQAATQPAGHHPTNRCTYSASSTYPTLTGYLVSMMAGLDPSGIHPGLILIITIGPYTYGNSCRLHSPERLRNMSRGDSVKSGKTPLTNWRCTYSASCTYPARTHAEPEKHVKSPTQDPSDQLLSAQVHGNCSAGSTSGFLVDLQVRDSRLPSGRPQGPPAHRALVRRE